MDSWLGHAAGSLAMMLPIGGVLAYRTQRSWGKAAAFLAVFASVWVVLGAALGAFGQQAEGLGNVAAAVALAGAGGWQFTARHADAVHACGVSGERGWRDGVLCARHCLVACGPLMAAMAVAGLHTTAVMVGFAAALVVQFTGRLTATAWAMGCVLTVAAIAVLFTGHGPLGWFAPTTHQHSASAS